MTHFSRDETKFRCEIRVIKTKFRFDRSNFFSVKMETSLKKLNKEMNSISDFVIANINRCGRYSTNRFHVPSVGSVIDHSWRQNVVKTETWHTRLRLVVVFTTFSRLPWSIVEQNQSKMEWIWFIQWSGKIKYRYTYQPSIPMAVWWFEQV